MRSNRLRRPLVLLAVFGVGIVGGSVATAAILRADAPVREVLAQTASPQGAKGRTMYLQRVTLPAGTPLAAHFHQGTQEAYIATGRLRYTVIQGLPVKVLKPDASGAAPRLVRLIKPGQTFTVPAGHSVVEPAGTVHEVLAVPGREVVIYVASLLRSDAPVSNPYDVHTDGS